MAECDKKCSECVLQECPGARGETCVVCAAEEIPAALTNALGDELPAGPMQKLARARAARRSAGIAGRAAVVIAGRAAIAIGGSGLCTPIYG